MKKKMYYLLVLLVMLSLSACGASTANKEASENIDSNEAAGEEKLPSQEELPASASDIDVDLTQLSSTMVFSEVYNMMVAPDDYIGKTIKMEGQFLVYQDQLTSNNYYAVIIEDATACCAQGLEFILKGDYSYPDDYPEVETVITVVGEFQTYEENGSIYCHLINSEIL